MASYRIDIKLLQSTPKKLSQNQPQKCDNKGFAYIQKMLEDNTIEPINNKISQSIAFTCSG